MVYYFSLCRFIIFGCEVIFSWIVFFFCENLQSSFVFALLDFLGYPYPLTCSNACVNLLPWGLLYQKERENLDIHISLIKIPKQRLAFLLHTSGRWKIFNLPFTEGIACWGGFGSWHLEISLFFPRYSIHYKYFCDILFNICISPKVCYLYCSFGCQAASQWENVGIIGQMHIKYNFVYHHSILYLAVNP